MESTKRAAASVVNAVGELRASRLATGSPSPTVVLWHVGLSCVGQQFSPARFVQLNAETFCNSLNGSPCFAQRLVDALTWLEYFEFGKVINVGVQE